MKKRILICFALMAFQANYAQQSAVTTYEYKIFTLVESVVNPITKTVGRSALIITNDKGEMNERYAEKVEFDGHANLKNIQYNDQVVTNQLNDLAKDGWVLEQAVVSDYFPDIKAGTYITRYIMKRPIAAPK